MDGISDCSVIKYVLQRVELALILLLAFPLSLLVDLPLVGEVNVIIVTSTWFCHLFASLIKSQVNEIREILFQLCTPVFLPYTLDISNLDKIPFLW